MGVLDITCALCVDQKYFGELTLSLKVLNGASLKKIGDFELPQYFVAYKYSLLNYISTNIDLTKKMFIFR